MAQVEKTPLMKMNLHLIKRRSGKYGFHCRTMVYSLISVLTVPFGFLLVMCAIPLHFQALYRAASTEEKKYWYLNVLGDLFVAYAIIVLFLLVIGECGERPFVLLDWLPSFSGLWCRSLHKTFLMLLDAVSMLSLGLGAMCAARYFGYVDEAGDWRSRKSDRRS